MLLALVLFGSGYWIGSQHEKNKQQTQTSKATIQNTNNEVRVSTAKSLELEKVTADTHEKIDNIKQKVIKRIEKTEPTIVVKHIKDDKENAIATTTVEPWVFDIGTIGLLNSARSNDPNPTTASDDALSETASTVTVKDFVSNDLAVVDQYHDLALKHEALQDYIRDKQSQGFMFCK